MIIYFSFSFFLLGIFFIFLFLHSKQKRYCKYSDGLFFLGLILQIIYLINYPYGYLNLKNALLFLSSFLIITYFFLKIFKIESASQPFFFFFSFFLTLFSLFVPKKIIYYESFKSLLFFMHLILIISGIAGIITALIYSILYNIQEKKLKERNPIGLDGFSPLEKSNIFSFKSLRDGYILFTLGIIFGFIWSFKTKGTIMEFNLKQISSIFSWIFFGILYFFQKKLGWRGKKVLFLYLIGFVSILLAIAGVKVF